MADDLGFECLSSYGSTSYQTPRIDALASEGIRFEHCYSQPLCTTSRVQIMTGRYNHRNYTEFGTLDPGETTFGHVLQEAGYATCITGKWQLAARNKDVPGSLPETAGFDEHCLWQVDRLGSRFWDPLIRQNGSYRRDLAGQYGPEIYCDYLLDFVSRHRAQPFFAYFPMALTHGPFLPTPHSDPSIARDASHPDNFAAMVAYTDHLVGRIVDHLDALGLRENTLILFTGDNGTPRGITSQLGNRTIHGGKAFPTDAGTHVPLVANWRGVAPAGQVTDDLVNFSDFMPTLAAVAGAGLPAGVIDGHSFLPRLRGQGGPARDWVFCHYEPRQMGSGAFHA